MKVVKHGHACLELIQNDERLIIDPGAYTEPLAHIKGVRAVVITHSHDDHCFEEQLSRLRADNPDLRIYGTAEVCARLSEFNTLTVRHGDFIQEGPFQLELFGDLHQEIHRSIPLLQNCGVMVNDSLYYPGDSYTQPDRRVELLACPASAPWLRVGDVMDFIAAVKPKRSFATHNALLSEIGNTLYNSRIKASTEAVGGSFEFLRVGDCTEV